MEGRNVYLVGQFYDSGQGLPKEEAKNFVVYRNIGSHLTRIIGSLTGVFVPNGERDPFVDFGDSDPIIPSGEIEEFERTYGGRFIPFEKGEVRFAQETVSQMAGRVNEELHKIS